MTGGPGSAILPRRHTTDHAPAPTEPTLLDIYIDADACPVKEETFKVALRYDLKVFLVSNAPLRVPGEGRVELVVVTDGFDAADDWIAERIGPGDICVTADIPLAKRCLDKGARAIGPKGVPFTPSSIGSAIAMRALMQDLREMARAEGGPQHLGGPAPFAKADRSRFLQELDKAVVQAKRLGK
ncbi:MAG: hypothetical protein RLY86_1400 [Pseudomonadota bacterium]